MTLACRIGAPAVPAADPPAVSAETVTVASAPAMDAASETAALQQKVNGLRRSQGVAELGFPAALQQIALARALELASADVLAHTNGEGKPAVLPMLESAGFSGLSAEHVLLVTDGGASFAATALRAWVSDRAHQADLLDPAYRAAGIGMAASADGWIVVQLMVERGGEEVAP